jgi:hypothetical protein
LEAAGIAAYLDFLAAPFRWQSMGESLENPLDVSRGLTFEMPGEAAWPQARSFQSAGSGLANSLGF